MILIFVEGIRLSVCVEDNDIGTICTIWIGFTVFAVMQTCMGGVLHNGLEDSAI